MTYGECIANLKIIKNFLDDNEQAEVIGQTIDFAISCVETSMKETELILRMIEADKK